MQILFFLVLFFLLCAGATSLVRGDGRDHVFKPWPFFPIVFSFYFMLGSLSGVVDVSDEQWFLYILAVVGFWLGDLFHRLVRGGRKVRREGRTQGAIYYSDTVRVKLIFAVWLFGLLVTVYIWGVHGIPLLSDNVDKARMEYASNGYVATLATSLDVMTIFLFCLLLSRLKVGSRRHIVFCIAALLVFVLVAVLGGSRSRIFKLIIPCAVIFHFVYGAISLRSIFLLGFLGVFIIGGVGYYRAYTLYGDMVWQGLGLQSDSVINAVLHYAMIELSTAVYGLSIVLDVIPERVNYTLGMLFVSPVFMALPMEVPTPGMFYKEIIGGTWDGAGLAATFIAPMYTDLSYFGVVLFSIFYSYLFSYLYSKAVGGGVRRNYYVVIYAIYYFFMISGMRSDFVSFEFMWFVSLSIGVLLFFRRRFLA